MKPSQALASHRVDIRRVAPEFAALHDDIPWQVMYTMRNRVSHGYDKVDLEIVWKTIQGDLPTLYQQVQEVAQGFPRNDVKLGMKP